MAVNVKKLLISFVLIIIGIALVPTVVEQVGNVTGNASVGNNLSGASRSLMGLLPMFWVIGVIGIGVALIYLSFRESGVSS